MIERIQCGAVNCYIVSQGGSAVLVDAGTANHREQIAQKCKSNNVKLLLLTHAHYDHAQNAAYLSQTLGIPVAMHPADVPLLENVLAEPVLANSLVGKGMAAFIRLSKHPKFEKWITRILKNEIPPFSPDIALYDGFSLKEYGVAAEVIALPGHTNGSVGLKMDKDLFVGDALMHMGRAARTSHYADAAAMAASAEKISGYHGATIYFGHGRPLKNRAW